MPTVSIRDLSRNASGVVSAVASSASGRAPMRCATGRWAIDKPTPGLEPGNLSLTMRVLYQLSYVGAKPKSYILGPAKMESEPG
jgi:hypothetical protein